MFIFLKEFGVEPMSAPPVFTPPEIPDHLVEDFPDALAAELAAEKSAFAFHQTIDQSNSFDCICYSSKIFPKYLTLLKLLVLFKTD